MATLIPVQSRPPARTGKCRPLLLVLAAAAAWYAAPRPLDARQTGASWAVVGGVLIDGTGTVPVAGSVITGTGEHIGCAGKLGDCTVAEDALRIDAAGKWIVPGLIDSHVHLDWDRTATVERDQLLRLASGVTTVRDAGSRVEASLARRAHAAKPFTPEPRLVVAAVVSNEAMTTRGVTDGPGLVRMLAALGVDAIKIKHALKPDQLRPIVDEAHRAGLPVFGHTWTDERSYLLESIAAGFDGVSHMLTFSEFAKRSDPARPSTPRDGVEAWVWVKEAWNYQDQSRQESATAALVKHNVWFEPLLVTEKHFTLPYPVPDDQPYVAEVRSLEQLFRASLPIGHTGWVRTSSRRTRIDAVFDRMCRVVADFRRRGGRVLVGTDDELPGPAVSDEIGLLTQCGFSPMTALQAATSSAATALRRNDLGTIKAGQLADFVILGADPLQDPANLRKVWRVFKGGHSFDPDVLLAPIRQDHAASWRRAVLARTAAAISILGMGAVMAVFLGRSRLRR